MVKATKGTERPPSWCMDSGFQIFFTSDSKWFGSSTGWVPVSSCYGLPYSRKGTAINKARNMVSSRWHKKASAFVLELKSSIVVWRSWKEEE